MGSIKILSWNILSPQLCQYNSPYFPKKYYNKKVTNSKIRLHLLFERLSKYIKDHKFICLQEVPSKWYQEIYSFFQTQKFESRHTTYGVSENELGVVVAWKKSYKIL